MRCNWREKSSFIIGCRNLGALGKGLTQLERFREKRVLLVVGLLRYISELNRPVIVATLQLRNAHAR